MMKFFFFNTLHVVCNWFINKHLVFLVDSDKADYGNGKKSNFALIAPQCHRFIHLPTQCEKNKNKQAALMEL